MPPQEHPQHATITESTRYQEYQQTPMAEYLIRERNNRLGVFVPLLNEVNTNLAEIYYAYSAVGGMGEPPAVLTNEPWIEFWRQVDAVGSPYTNGLKNIWFGAEGIPQDEQELIDHPSFKTFSYHGNMLKSVEGNRVQFKTRKVPFDGKEFPYVAHTHIDTPGIFLDIYLRENNTTLEELSLHELRMLRDMSILLAGHDTLEEGVQIIGDTARPILPKELYVHVDENAPEFSTSLMMIGVPTLTESPFDEMVRNSSGNRYPIAMRGDVFEALGTMRKIFHERKGMLGDVNPDMARRLSKVYQNNLLVYGSHARQIRAVYNELQNTDAPFIKHIGNYTLMAELVDRMSEMMDLDRYIGRGDTLYHKELTFFHAAKIKYMESQIIQALLDSPVKSFEGTVIGQILKHYDALFDTQMNAIDMKKEFYQYFQTYFMPYQEEISKGEFVEMKSRAGRAIERFDDFAREKAKVIVQNGLPARI